MDWAIPWNVIPVTVTTYGTSAGARRLRKRCVACVRPAHICVDRCTKMDAQTTTAKQQQAEPFYIGDIKQPKTTVYNTQQFMDKRRDSMPFNSCNECTKGINSLGHLRQQQYQLQSR